jgi:hypothetical protein
LRSLSYRELLGPILRRQKIAGPPLFIRLSPAKRRTKKAQAFTLRRLWITGEYPSEVVRSQAVKLLTSGKSPIAKLWLSVNLRRDPAQTHTKRRDYRLLSSGFERNRRRH